MAHRLLSVEETAAGLARRISALEDSLMDVRNTYKRKSTSASESARNAAYLCVDHTRSGGVCRSYRMRGYERCAKHQGVFEQYKPIVLAAHSDYLSQLADGLGSPRLSSPM